MPNYDLRPRKDISGTRGLLGILQDFCHMLDWLRAYGLAIYYFPLWPDVVPCVAGALAGATLGSVGRWYGARWQIGMVSGLWIGGQYALIGCTYGTPWPFRDKSQVLQIAGVLGMAVALLSSALSAWWFTVADGYWTRFVKNRPGRWLRHRGVHILAVITVVILIPLSIVLFQGPIQHYQKILPYYDDYQSISKKWEPYGAVVTGELGQSLTLVVRTRRGLSDDSLKLMSEAPWPVEGLSVFGCRDVRDVDLIDAVPGLASIQRISLLNSSLSDQCLPALANCPNLKFLDVDFCQAITAAGLKEFHQLRPDIHVRQNGSAASVIVDGQPVYTQKFELELLPQDLR